MGLGKTQYTDGTKLSIGFSKDDKGRPKAVIGMRVPAGTPKAKQVFKVDGSPALDKDNKEVYRLEYDFLAGRIVALKDREQEFNGKITKYLDVHVNDVGDLYVLSLPRGERYWSDLLLRLNNVDLTKDVKLTPYSIKDDETGKTGKFLIPYQDGKKVERSWSRDNNEGGPPQPTQMVVNEENVWDWGPRNKWLEENVLAPAREKLSFLSTPAEGDAPKAMAPVDGDLNNEPPVDEDDLPF